MRLIANTAWPDNAETHSESRGRRLRRRAHQADPESGFDRRDRFVPAGESAPPPAGPNHLPERAQSVSCLTTALDPTTRDDWRRLLAFAQRERRRDSF